jgi:hypothetical protein
MMIVKLLFTALLWRQAHSQTISANITTASASAAVVVDDGTNNTDNNPTKTETQQQPTNNNVIIYPRHLTFQELQRLISSEIGVEYNYYNTSTSSANNNIEATLEEEDWGSTITESTWNASIQYEWSKALSAEKEESSSSAGGDGVKYPHLICHTGKEMSGYQRRIEIVDALTNNYTTATSTTTTNSTLR